MGGRLVALAGTLILLAGVVTLGVCRGAADAPARDRLEQALRVQVRVRSAELALTRDRVGELGRQVAAGRAQQRRAAERQARSAAEVAALGPPGGWVAVRGPGVRITVSGRLPAGVGATGSGADSDSGAGSGAGDDRGRITDHDVADLVNVLWIAGAEAISVNQVRLTTLSAIRAAADVILVGLVPVTAPYVIEAVGDADELTTRLGHSAVIDRLRHRPDSPATTLTVSPAGTVILPAAQLPVLRDARRSG
ncbi:DUF881 domain-containing protein [Frankia sp. R82]|uniref:DUF881 domain-containing protein n=1 Tax=Frankia sp. R82 TaxID=2950553 RepID=UPI002042C3A4|nr:DUF881 domain-containing protein [Frankia sp. R82]MCM3885984.1 DUF881 domain-containing protein [Frankia sp. R82]